MHTKIRPKRELQDFNLSTHQMAHANAAYANHASVAASSNADFALEHQNSLRKPEDNTFTATSTTVPNTNEKHQCCTNSNQVLITQNKMLSNQTQILEHLKSLKQFQNIAIQKIKRFSVQLLTLSQKNRSTFSKPIENCRELDELEKKLSDHDARKQLKNTYSIILCNAGKGLNCAYVLVDMLFSRDFLCQCSWTGGSRSGDSKICWKQYKNVLIFFWEVIHLCDSNYSIKDNEDFFKNILKCSKTRKLAKKVTSMSHTHSKTIESNMLSDDSDFENENADSLENVSVQNHDKLSNVDSVNQTAEKERRDEFDLNVTSEYQVHSAPDYNNSNVVGHQCCTYMKHVLVTHKQMLFNQTQILDQLKCLENFQSMAIKKITTFSVQLDDALLEINDKANENQNYSLEKHKSTFSNYSFHELKPIENIAELDELEKKLADSVMRKKLKSTYSILCSKGKGLTCAYSLADLLFSRGFLCLCSWSGGSRGGDAKICFKMYKKTLTFFWELIHSWDSSYSLKENETFFKMILRNSKKRHMSKQERASTSRNRSKRTKAIETNSNGQANESNALDNENNYLMQTETVDIDSDEQRTDESGAEDDENIIEHFDTQYEKKSSDEENIKTKKNNDLIESEQLEQMSIIKVEYEHTLSSPIRTSNVAACLSPQDIIGSNTLQLNCASQDNINKQSCTNINQIFAIQKQMLSNQSEMLEKVKTLKQFQNITIEKITNFSVQLDDAQLQLNNQITDNHYSLTKSLENCKSDANYPLYELKPIETAEEFDELEKKLSDSHTRNEMKSTFSILCSGGRGVDCAYTLVDLLFSREFICQCSWAGGSRGGDAKICFKVYKNTLTFFWEIIHTWDATYTLTENVIFFKNVLRNSKQRSMSQQKRRSSSKRRQKRVKQNVYRQKIIKKNIKDDLTVERGKKT